MRKGLSILVFSFLIVSCTSRPVEPTRESRNTIDTLFESKASLMQPELDSLCQKLSAEIYKAAVDSIMAVRKSEMNILVQ